jgi:hypothetical protein
MGAPTPAALRAALDLLRAVQAHCLTLSAEAASASPALAANIAATRDIADAQWTALDALITPVLDRLAIEAAEKEDPSC